MQETQAGSVVREQRSHWPWDKKTKIKKKKKEKKPEATV